MTNFIYIFMIITLIGIGVGIKAFNSEDSDTKTIVKNIPRGLKKVLLIGKNVNKTDIVMLIVINDAFAEKTGGGNGFLRLVFDFGQKNGRSIDQIV